MLQYGSLKIKRPVYHRFRAAQEGRETQTETLLRLLDMWDTVDILVRQFSGSPEYLEWRRTHGNPPPPVEPRRDSQEVPHMLSG